MPVLDVTTATATIGSFVLSGIGLGHLFKATVKHPSSIIKETRRELSNTFTILDTFQEIIQDDCMIPLVIRYTQLDQVLLHLEDRMELQKGFKQKMKSYISDKHVAIQARRKSHILHRVVRAASDKARLAELLKKKGLAPDGQRMPSTPHPIPVAGCSGPLHFGEYELINLSTTTFCYPPQHQVGSLASLVSNPFRDPTGTTPI